MNDEAEAKINEIKAALWRDLACGVVGDPGDPDATLKVVREHAERIYGNPCEVHYDGDVVVVSVVLQGPPVELEGTVHVE